METMLDPTIQPFLRDHQIESTPVLLGVMGIEAFAMPAARPARGVTRYRLQHKSGNQRAKPLEISVTPL
jgi:hypothetical protein